MPDEAAATSEARTDAPPDRLDTLLLALCGAAFGLGAFLAVTAPDNHDVAWLLYAARQVAGGADLYRDVIETNPPLIVYALWPVTSLAAVLGVPSMVVFRSAVLILAAVMLAWTARLAYLALPAGARTGLAAALTVAVCLLVVVPGFHVGQRDHLVILLMLPLLATSVARARGVPIDPRVAVAVGCCGAVGIALKPFALVAWVGVEAYLLTRRTVAALRPETWSVIAVGATYLAAVALFEPDYFGFASAALGTYRDYYPASPLILARQPSTLLALGAIVLSLIVRPGDDYREVRRVLEVATGAFLVMVFVQNKGFLYHWIPVHATTALLLTVVFVERLAAPAVRRRAGQLLRVVGVGVVAATSVWSYRDLREIRTEWAEFSFYLPNIRSVFEQHAEGEAVMALTVRLPPGLTLAVAESSPVQWGSRFNVLWPIPGLYRDATPAQAGFPYHAEADRSDLEWFLIAAVTEDFIASRPALVIFELVSPVGLDGFNVLEYLQRSSPAFREEFRRYEPLMRMGDYLIFRRGGAPPGDPA